MTAAFIRFSVPRLGFRLGYLIDEHGCLQNTEAVCSVPEEFHNWFIQWLEAQKFERPDGLVFCALKENLVKS